MDAAGVAGVVDVDEGAGRGLVDCPDFAVQSLTFSIAELGQGKEDMTQR